MQLKFTKMHGIGNDYIYFCCLDFNIKNPSQIAVALSNRHFGIGSDGIVIIMSSNIADFRMRIFNADGSEAEMCGNAIRCVGKYLYDKGINNKKTLYIETIAGIKKIELLLENDIVNKVRVNLGKPVWESNKIPVKINKKIVIDEKIIIDKTPFFITALSLGNPHCVVFIKNINNSFMRKWGQRIANLSIFPNKTNVEFVKIINRHKIEVHVWERGSGETLACGTGAAAAFVVALKNKLIDKNIICDLPGGSLNLKTNLKGEIIKTGPAKIVFEGEIEI